MEYQDLNRISSEMKERRLAYGYTQEQAAEKIGISYSYYAKIENTIQAPSLDTIIKICEAFHISLDELFLTWPAQTRLSAKQLGLMDELQQMEPEQLLKCRSILDKLLALAQDCDPA